MRTILGCVALLTMASGLAVADEKVDFDKLVGKWELTEASKGPMLQLEFTKDKKIRISIGEAGKETKLEGTYQTSGNNKLDVSLKFMGEDIKEVLIIIKLTDEELVTEDSKGKSETMKKKK